MAVADQRQGGADITGKGEGSIAPPLLIVSTVLLPTTAEVSVAPPPMKVTSTASPAPKPEITAGLPKPALVVKSSTSSVPAPSNVNVPVTDALGDCKSPDRR